MGRWRVLPVIAALLALSSTGCGGGAGATDGPGPTPGDVPPLAERYEDFDPASFDATSIDIDNRFLPFPPGRHWVYRGSDLREGKRTRHRVEMIVTDLTQVVDGVRTIVLWERDWVGRHLEEAELVYLAQDTAGNVWHLGQYSEVYEDKEMVGSTGFLVGHLEDARAGIVMQADPQADTPSYSQGYGPPPIYWTDRARVAGVGKKTTVPAGTYDDVLVIEEYTETERTAFQLKYYAPGVGNVRVGFSGDDESAENLVLVKDTELDAAGVARARAGALELEARAKMYGSTAPSEIR